MDIHNRNSYMEIFNMCKAILCIGILLLIVLVYANK